MLALDQLVIAFDNSLRTVFASARAARANPAADLPEAGLNEAEKREAEALMRVNHVGEVCAQALYQGQALTARNPEARAALEEAAREETDHLAWCESRINELGGRKSLLNPLWYAGIRPGRHCRQSGRQVEPGLPGGNRAPGGSASGRAFAPTAGAGAGLASV